MTSPYREPGPEREFLEQEFRNYWAEVDARATEKAAQEAATRAENRFWGFSGSPESLGHLKQLPEDHFRLEDVVKEPWCRDNYETPAWLIKFLRKYEYPERILMCGLITKSGFDILFKRKIAAERESDRARKGKTRAAERAAKQVSEPNTALKKQDRKTRTKRNL